MTALLTTNTPDDNPAAFLSLLTTGSDQRRVLEAAIASGEIVSLTDRDARIGTAVMIDAAHNTVRGVFYAYRPDIHVSGSHPEALRASVIYESLTRVFGTPVFHRSFGDRDSSSEGHELRWGTGSFPFCQTATPARAPAPGSAIDRSAFSLAIDPGNPPRTTCRQHAGFSHNRSFDNESIFLWMLGDI